VKSGVPEGLAFPSPHATPVMMSLMSYQGMKRTRDNNIMDYVFDILHYKSTFSLCVFSCCLLTFWFWYW